MNREDQSIDERAERSSNDLSISTSNESQTPLNNHGVGDRQNNNNDAKQDDDDDGEEESQLLFSSQCESARTIATLLSCLKRVVTANSGSSWSASAATGGGGGITQGGGSGTQRTVGGTQSTAAMALSGGSANKIQHATVYAGPNGLTFHVQHGLAKQSQCSVDMPKGLFREYFVGEEEVWLEDSDVEDDDGHGSTQRTLTQGRGGNKEIIQGGEFGVNLTNVLECFSILSKNKSSTPSGVASGNGTGGGSGGASEIGNKAHVGEYASLSNVPLCMSYDRGTATFHLEFLEGGSLSTGEAAANSIGGGCLVTCEVPGVAVADDVDDGPDGEELSNHRSVNTNNNSGLASAFRSSPLLSRAILYSDALQSAVSELFDVPGASIVTILLSEQGIEFGTVGPRSEVWVNVPYHRGQGGMYVGLECYKPNVPLFGIASSSSSSSHQDAIVRTYPLGAFLSGMRGLDIGVETCISVNSRGMMAIQHQVSRDGYFDRSEDGGGKKVKPSFVDFIMTCIEDEADEEGNDGDTISQDSTSVEMQQQHNRLQDITNEDRSAHLEIGKRNKRETVAKSRAGRCRAKAATRGEDESVEEDDKRPGSKARKKGAKHDAVDSDDGDTDAGASGDIDFGDEHEYLYIDGDNATKPSMTRPTNNHTNRILEELEMDKDMVSSHRKGAVGKGRKNALNDLRRRRQEQRQRQSPEYQNENEMQQDDEHFGDDADDSGDISSDENLITRRKHTRGRKRRSGSSKSAAPRKGARRGSKENDCDNSDSNRSENRDGINNGTDQSKQSRHHHSNPAQDGHSHTQSEEEDGDDDDGDETEHEDSLDVTAEIPQMFSKRSSLSTSHHVRSRRSSLRIDRVGIDGGDDNSEEEEEQEPRMMYGDTKLEFTQDGYENEGSL